MSNEIRYNDKGQEVPKKCPKCGSTVDIMIQGEPIYRCSNKDCKQFFGTVPCNVNESKNIFTSGDIARMDDKELNQALLKDATDPAKTMPWNSSLDIPYMRDNGMLGDVSSQYTMRSAAESDLEFVYQSELETVGENKNDPKVQKYIYKDAKESLGHTKIIVMDDADIGVYQAYETNYYGLREGKRDWWYLAHIYIKPEYRNLGIGSDIIKNDIKNHDKILLQVMKSNTRAKKLYESLGFVVDMENDHGGLVMRLDKSKPIQESFICEYEHAHLDKYKNDDPRFRRVMVPSDEAVKYLKEDPELSQYWEDLQKATNGEFLVDRETGEPIGHVFVHTNKKNKGFIFNLEVNPKYRRQGYGWILTDDAVCRFGGEDLTVDADNEPAIQLYLKYGFEIYKKGQWHYDPPKDEYWMKYKRDKSKSVTESLYIESFTDGKTMFHISKQSYLDGQIFKPRIPEYLGEYNPNDTDFENNTTPRVCVSPSIEGCFNAIYCAFFPQHPLPSDKLYVYTPEKPFREYKHKTNKEIIRDKDVYDANLTKEVWILEPVRMRLYGVIQLDQLKKVKQKKTVPTTSGEYDKRAYFNIKWHWLVTPKVAKSRKVEYDIMHVCKNLVSELRPYKYGLIKDGKLSIHDNSEKDFDKWRLSSVEDFERAGGGNCYDFTEWEDGYLKLYGVKCNKYFISATYKNKYATHTFIVVPFNNKFIYIERAFERIYNEIDGLKIFDKLNDIFDYILECMCEFENVPELNYLILEYSDATPNVGTPMKQFQEYIITNGDEVYSGTFKTRKD